MVAAHTGAEMTLPGSVMNNIAKILQKKGVEFSLEHSRVLRMISSLRLWDSIFSPLQYNARRVRKRDAKPRAEMLEEPEASLVNPRIRDDRSYPVHFPPSYALPYEDAA